jgi:VWFA-related protein
MVLDKGVTAALLLALGFSSSGAGATAAAPSLAEAITVELVNVDVHVFDRQGRPLAGMPRDAFRVFEDGIPIEVSHFSWVPGVPAESASAFTAAAAPTTAAPLHLAVLFDELQAGDRSRLKLVQALRTKLVAALQPEDRVTVLRFDGAEVQVLLESSSDRRQLDQALIDLATFSPRRLLTANETRSMVDALAADVTGDACQHTLELLRIYADTVLTQVKSSASAVLRSAHRLAAAPGRKVLLHVSDGIPMVAGGEGYEYAIEMCDGTAMTKGVPGAYNVAFDGADQFTVRDRFDPSKARMEFSDFSTARLWTDVAARVNTLGVTVYTLQSGDSASRFLPEIESIQSRSSSTARMFASENPRETLAFLAADTGGLMLDVTSNEAAGVSRLVGDLGGYYSLAFAPTVDGRGGLRRVRVEVEQPGATVRYRQSYRLQSAHERVADQLAMLFEAERMENPLGLRLAIVPGKEPAPTKATLTVPLNQLTFVEGTDGARAGRVTVFLAGKRRGGGIHAVRERTLDLALPAGHDESGAKTYTYEVTLPDSFAEVAVAILDEYSGKLAYAKGR